MYPSGKLKIGLRGGEYIYGLSKTEVYARKKFITAKTQSIKGCYVIEISFLAKKSFNYGWLLLAFIPVAFGGLYFARTRNKISEPQELIEEKVDESLRGKAESVPVIADYKKLGNFVFFESKGILSLNGETIVLSVKEAKALSILASSQNQVVGRDLLMKEIWEDDGVFCDHPQCGRFGIQTPEEIKR